MIPKQIRLRHANDGQFPCTLGELHGPSKGCSLWRYQAVNIIIQTMDKSDGN